MKVKLNVQKPIWMNLWYLCNVVHYRRYTVFTGGASATDAATDTLYHLLSCCSFVRWRHYSTDKKCAVPSYVWARWLCCWGAASFVQDSPLSDFSQASQSLSIVIQGQWNRSGRLGDCRTNVCCIVPEKPADVMSEVLRPKISPRFVQLISYFAASA